MKATTFWFRGEEYKVTTASYKLFGGWFFDGVNDAGKTVTQPTPEQKQADSDGTHATS